MKKISCIICAYNEGPRIGAVLAVATRHPSLEEIIVVDDGSTDETSKVASTFPCIRLIRLPKNVGKSGAMAAGVKIARGDFLCLLDADLRGLTNADITALTNPVLTGSADICFSLRRNNWQVMGIDPVTGERVVPRSLLAEVLPEMERLPRFGVEVFINKRIIDQNLRVAVARFDKATHTFKIIKYGLRKGIYDEWRMIPDVLGVYSPLTPFVQIYSLALLRSDVEWAKWLRRTSPKYVSGYVRNLVDESRRSLERITR